MVNLVLPFEIVRIVIRSTFRLVTYHECSAPVSKCSKAVQT